ncbi:MAG: HEAT repeat domain-containing protein [Planctomycetota bacterium]|nr:HEAT repeat domain-containing protein [Planctomycetota bacterium]
MSPSLLPFLALALQGSGASVPVLSLDEQIARTRGHYSVVLDELVAADTRQLSEVQRAGRSQVLMALRAYRDRGDFGRGYDLDARVPYFVDAEGRRCAVAELLHASGELALIERVRATNNHAWILDLAGDAAFEAWLRDHGLSFDEAARIQTPVTSKADRVPADTANPPGPTPPPPPGAPGTKPTPPSTGGASAPGSRPSAALAMATSDDDEWWLWWEYSKLEFLLPNRPSPASAPLTGAYVPGALHDAIERARAAEFPRFCAASRAPEAVIRGAAATALGASGGRDAVEPLVKLLADPNQEVRHRAILALGATGSSSAAALLLRIARDGALEGAGARISPYARSLAIVALALARHAGLEQPVDGAVRAIVRERPKGGGDSEGVAFAAMFHHVLAPAPGLEELALELAFAEHEPPGVRCRAAEALGSTRDPATLAKLQTLLSGPRLDLRRSAALALGATRDSRAQPGLMTAWELEADPLTRGFVLISIGRTGGAKAHAYLARILREGEADERCWAAIALGVLARETRDPETSKLLRDALDRERQTSRRAAYWLACGLVRDEDSIDLLAGELRSAADPRARMYAATALALIGGMRPAGILRQRLLEEPSSLGRVAIAQGLGILGQGEDTRAMRGALERLAEPALQGIAATALAFHGSLAALEELADLSHAETGTRVRRAASIEGLGLLLSRGEPLALSLLSRRANYTVLPDWAQSMFQTTL